MKSSKIAPEMVGSLGVARRVLWRLIAAAIAAVVVGCGAGGGGGGGAGGAGGTLGGVMNVSDFSIPAGQTRTVGSDLTINATGKIQIDGTLQVPTGTNVSLLASGPVVVNGSIVPDPSRSTAHSTRSVRRDVNSNVAILVSGRAITLGSAAQTQLSKVLRAPSGTSVYLACTAPDGTITIESTVATDDGPAGTGTITAGPFKGFPAPGTKAGDIEIGTAVAIAAVKQAGVAAPSAPATLQITANGNVDAGNGGPGQAAVALDPKALDPPTAALFGIDDKTVAYANSAGGTGGSIHVQAGLVKPSPTSTKDFNGGSGGESGDTGSATKPIQLPKAPTGQSGTNLVTIVAAGGQRGDVPNSTDSQRGTRGPVGRVWVTAADGGDGFGGTPAVAPGAGGNISIYVWDPAFQAMNQPWFLRAYVLGGGNGGNAADPTHAGGNGGVVSLFRVTPGAAGALPQVGGTPYVDGLSISNFGSGGAGFGGCSVTPTQPGSNGGSAGTAPSKAAQTALVLNGAMTSNLALVPSFDKSFNGGDGGGGAPIGVGGKGGKDDAGRVLGSAGTDGAHCGCAPGTYTAVLVGPGEGLATNHLGHVVGTSGGHAWFWDGSQQKQIGDGTATAINDSDVVVGYTGGTGAWIWDASNGRRPLPDLFGSTKSWAYGINNGGIVVGQAAVPAPNSGPAGFEYEAVQWTNRVPTALPSLATDETAAALAINDSGIIVGSDKSAVNGNAFQAVRWQNGTITALAPLQSGGYTNKATAINSAGDAVGLAGLQGGLLHAVVWKAGGTTPTDLTGGTAPPSSQALGANAAITVGFTGDSPATGSVAAVFSGGSVAQLQSLLCGGPMLVFYEATAVNDRGQIVANDRNTGAYLLMPN